MVNPTRTATPNRGAETRKGDDVSTTSDARGQFAKSRADRKNNGLVSATPRTVTGHDDATLEDVDKKPAPKPGYDIMGNDE